MGPVLKCTVSPCHPLVCRGGNNMSPHISRETVTSSVCSLSFNHLCLWAEQWMWQLLFMFMSGCVGISLCFLWPPPLHVCVSEPSVSMCCLWALITVLIDIAVYSLDLRTVHQTGLITPGFFFLLVSILILFSTPVCLFPVWDQDLWREEETLIWFREQCLYFFKVSQNVSSVFQLSVAKCSTLTAFPSSVNIHSLMEIRINWFFLDLRK